MTKSIIFSLSILTYFSLQGQPFKKNHPAPIALAVHGGASNIKNLNLSPEQELAYTQAIDSALSIGYQILTTGGTAIDAVSKMVVYLEDNPLFNAGRGSVFAADSSIQMDAAIMDGNSLKCGAVSGVQTTKNPILVARTILEKSNYIFLYGKGAEHFASANGLEIVDPSYFRTPYRWSQFQKVVNTDTVKLDNDSRGSADPIDDSKFEKFGTVGAVARDQYGNLAAATSTGGLLNKKYNRIGDSPIIGAGTYANNETCAISCTGKGEDFLRLVVGHEISARMRYKHESLETAVNEVIQNDLKAINGRGGCIAIDKKGNISISFTTSGMFHGYIDKKGHRTVAIYANAK
jgi:beta-aspartyl-peptidase (threonine type)